MLILAIDTSLEAAGVCLFDSASLTELAVEHRRLPRGHDEILLSLAQKVMSVREKGFAELDRIAVTVGPGSFTGLRIGVAAARAFGLVTGASVVGVSTLAAFAAPSLASGREGAVLSAVDARHGRVFAQVFAADGRVLVPARLMSVADALRQAGTGSLRLVGSGAPLLAIEAWRQGRQADPEGDLTSPPLDYVARLGALADPATAPPRPLYLKPAEVTPSAPLASGRRTELHPAAS